jgi:hypothetical protein
MTQNEMIGNGLLLVALFVALMLVQALITGTIQGGKPPRVRIWQIKDKPIPFLLVWLLYLAVGGLAGYVGLRLLDLLPKGWAA